MNHTSGNAHDKNCLGNCDGHCTTVFTSGNDKTSSVGKGLDETTIADMLNAVWERGDSPVKILTNKDLGRNKVATFMGVPIFVDHSLPKGAWLVEYDSGYREPLNTISVREIEENL